MRSKIGSEVWFALTPRQQKILALAPVLPGNQMGARGALERAHGGRDGASVVVLLRSARLGDAVIAKVRRDSRGSPEWVAWGLDGPWIDMW